MLQSVNREHLLRVSFLEIYNDEMFDLLYTGPKSNRPEPRVRERQNGEIFVEPLEEIVVNQFDCIMQLLKQGLGMRTCIYVDILCFP